jgi:hypothetical protein
VPSIAAVQPVRVATWIEASTRILAAPSVKQRLAAAAPPLRWLVNGQVVPVNPALASAAIPRARYSAGLAAAPTHSILHLVHKNCPVDLAAKMIDFSTAAVARRWQAGETGAAMSLADPRRLAPPKPAV